MLSGRKMDIGKDGYDQKQPPRPNDREVITVSGLRKLVEQQHFRCALTGRNLTPETASVDHVVPLSKGGLHTIGNLQVIHSDINRAKGTMTMDQFIAMCREVVEYMGDCDCT